MLKFQKRRFGIAFNYVWFAKTVPASDALRLKVFLQCERPGNPLLGFMNRKIHVKVVDLGQSEDALLEDMKPRSRSDVRRAMRDGVEIREISDKSTFLDFYNAFADLKQPFVPRLDSQVHWSEDTLVLGAWQNDQFLVMNHYIVDRHAGRARMMYSASHFRGVDSSDFRNQIGRANRLLHYDAMCRFKRLGLVRYDFGQYDPDTQDPSLLQVNRFKDTFGGFVEGCYRSYTLPMALLINAQLLRQKLMRLLRGQGSAAPAGEGVD